jgi:flagellar motor switch protein FliN/FliY
MTDNPEPAATGPVDVSSPFSSVPVEISVSVGKARPTVQELLQMGENTVLTLDRRVDDPVELFMGDQLIARGELEECPDDPTGLIAVRLTRIHDLKDSLG